MNFLLERGQFLGWASEQAFHRASQASIVVLTERSDKMLGETPENPKKVFGLHVSFQGCKSYLGMRNPSQQWQVKVYRNPYAKNDVFKYVSCIFGESSKKKQDLYKIGHHVLCYLKSVFHHAQCSGFLGWIQGTWKIFAQVKLDHATPRFGVKIGVSPNHQF